MKNYFKKNSAFIAFLNIFFLYCIGNLVYASDQPSIQINQISYTDSNQWQIDYDFSEGDLIMYDYYSSGERLTLFLPDYSYSDPENKTYVLTAWHNTENAIIDNSNEFLEFSVPNLEDCSQGSIYGTFILEQTGSHTDSFADNFNLSVEFENLKNFNAKNRYHIISTGFSSRHEYYHNEPTKPKYNVYFELMVINGYTSSGNYYDGALIARIKITKKLDNGSWTTDWKFLGDGLDYENIKIGTTLNATVQNGIQYIRATCKLNDMEEVHLELDPSDEKFNGELDELDLRPFQGLAEINQLLTGCLKMPESINVPPTGTISLDTSVAGQTATTASGSPVTLLVSGQLADIFKVHVNSSEQFSTATAYVFSDPVTKTLEYDVSGTGSKTLYAWFEDEVGNISDAVNLSFEIQAGKSMAPAGDLNLEVDATQAFEISGGGDTETFDWTILDAVSGLASTAAAFEGASTGVATVIIKGVTENQKIKVKAVSSDDDAVYESGVVSIPEKNQFIVTSNNASPYVGEKIFFTVQGNTGDVLWEVKTGADVAGELEVSGAINEIATVTPTKAGKFVISATDSGTGIKFDHAEVTVYTVPDFGTLPTEKIEIQPGENSAEFTVSGGDGTYKWSVVNPNGSTGPDVTTANYTFTAPSTGSFAGTYTITAAGSGGFSHTFDIYVPLKVEPDMTAVKLLSNANPYPFTLTGAADPTPYTITIASLDDNQADVLTTGLFAGNMATYAFDPKNYTVTADTGAKSYSLNFDIQGYVNPDMVDIHVIPAELFEILEIDPADPTSGEKDFSATADADVKKMFGTNPIKLIIGSPPDNEKRDVAVAKPRKFEAPSGTVTTGLIWEIVGLENSGICVTIPVPCTEAEAREVQAGTKEVFYMNDSTHNTGSWKKVDLSNIVNINFNGINSLIEVNICEWPLNIVGIEAASSLPRTDFAGFIVDHENTPLSGARITINAPAEYEGLSQISAAATGAFEFSDLPVIEYEFKAEKYLYESKTFSSTEIGDDGLTEIKMNPLYTQDQLEEAIADANEEKDEIISTMFTQEQLEKAVADANKEKDEIIATMYTQEQLDQILEEWDVNEDGYLGLEEAINALQTISGMKTAEKQP